MISRHFDLDRVRGSLITSQSIFQVELNGYSVSGLQDFSAQVMKVLNSIPHEQWPNQQMLGEFLFHKLRTVRRLERVIDEIKRSPDGSTLRDFDYLWPRLQEFLFEEREDANATSIEQSLKRKSLTAPKPKAPAVPAKAAPAATKNAGAAAAPSKAVPKKADPKSHPKGKGKGRGKPLAPKRQKCFAFSIRCLRFVFMVQSARTVMPPKLHLPSSKPKKQIQSRNQSQHPLQQQKHWPPLPFLQRP